MKIGIISDSHDSFKNICKAVKVFCEQGVDYVFHAGDIESPTAVGVFADLKGAKFIAVFGNCDKERIAMAEEVESFGGQIHKGPYICEVGGKRIFITHRLSQPENVAESGEYDLVIYGHTHKFDVRKIGGTLLVNPGKSGHRLLGRSGVVIVELDDMSTEEICLK